MNAATTPAERTRYLVIRVDLNGKRTPSRVRRSLGAARKQAAATQTADPSAAVSILILPLGKRAPAGFRVVRRAPAGDVAYPLDAEPYRSREVAEHVAERVSAAHPAQTVVVEPVDDLPAAVPANDLEQLLRASVVSRPVFALPATVNGAPLRVLCDGERIYRRAVAYGAPALGEELALDAAEAAVVLAAHAALERADAVPVELGRAGVVSARRPEPCARRRSR